MKRLLMQFFRTLFYRVFAITYRNLATPLKSWRCAKKPLYAIIYATKINFVEENHHRMARSVILWVIKFHVGNWLEELICAEL